MFKINLQYLVCSAILISSLGTPMVTIAAEPSSSPTITQAQTGVKRRIAVLDFESSSITGNALLGSGVVGNSAARGISDMVINKLVDSGSYQIIERSRLDQIIREQNLGESGRMDASSIAAIGKLLGVDAVVVGSIRQFSVESSSTSGGLGGIFGGIFGGGNATSKKSTGVVKLTARIIDTGTGAIIATAQGEGREEQGSGGISGFGNFGLGISTDVNNPESLLNGAAEKAITQLVTGVTEAAPKITASSSIEAVVADVTGNQVTLNQGSSAGFTLGMKVSVARIMKQVKDPSTGKVIRNVTSSIGQLELTEVTRDYSVGRVISGSGFKAGDTAKSVP